MRNIKHGCPICQKVDSEWVCTVRDYDIVRCINCKLEYTDPIPNEASVINLYQDETPVIRSAIVQFRKYLKFRRRMSVITKLSTVQGRFLDIGCAHGDWGSAVQGNRKWDYLGLELNKGLLNYAKNRGLAVAYGTLADQNFPSEEFALVTMTHVLEHLYDPRATLNEVYRILQPSGLVVVEVPDSSHPKASIKKKQGRWYGPPGHLWYFSKQNLHHFLNNVGFTPLHSMRKIVKPYVQIIARKADRSSFSMC